MKSLMALGLAVGVGLPALAEDPAWPATFATDYAAHVQSVKSTGTTTATEVWAGSLAACCLASDKSVGCGSEANPFDARFFVTVGTLPVWLSNPSGFLLIFR